MWAFPGDVGGKNPPANAGTRVQSLAWEDSTSRKAAKPVMYSTETALESLRARPLKPAHLEPVCNKGSPTPHEDSRRSPQLEKSPHTATKTSAAENK